MTPGFTDMTMEVFYLISPKFTLNKTFWVRMGDWVFLTMSGGKEDFILFSVIWILERKDDL